MSWLGCMRRACTLLYQGHDVRHVRHVRHVSTTCAIRSQDYYLTKTSDGQLVRLHLNNAKQLLGLVSTRGTRDYNEDRYRAVTLELPESTHLRTMGRASNRVYTGVFDGHGGPLIADWLAGHLHERIESVTVDAFAPVMAALRGYGGYFRRFKIPTILNNLMDETGHRLPSVSNTDLTLEQRIMLAFLSADTQCLSMVKNDGRDEDQEGSTCSIAIIEPQDDKPFWDSDTFDIVIGHVGDTRILLCDASSGQAKVLTTGDHHPGNPAEHERLRKYAGFVTTDSWGDERLLGMLATSRAFGDAKLKRFGVSAEPDIVRYPIRHENPAAFMVLVTDGITSVMSDQEIVDVVKLTSDPTASAKKIIDLADQYGSEDNCTAMVVRLRDWDTSMPDSTKDLREYRISNASMSNRQSW